MTSRAIRASLLGEQTAENDSSLLLENYVETPEYRSILETRDSTVVVGRRGTGKSAMYLQLAKFWSLQKGNGVIRIAPEDFQTIGFRGLLKKFDSKYSYTRAISRIAWKYGLYVEILSELSRNYKVKAILNDLGTALDHTKKWNTNQGDFLTKLTFKLRSVLNKSSDIEESITNLSHDLDIHQLEEDINQVLSSSDHKLFILIDRLDEGYENDETGAAIIAGVIAVVAEINKKFPKIRPVLFQRDNIIRSVAKFDPDYTRNIEGELIRIHWDTHQLLNLVTKRLNSALNLKIENSQRIWDRCTANESPERELQGKSGFKKCLQFTLYRPRDLLSLLNQAFYEASKQDRSALILSDIEKTAKIISETRLEDLKKEYKSIIPSISLATNVFANGNPELTYNQAISLLDSIPTIFSLETDSTIQVDYRILGSDGILRALYSVGFIGSHDESSGAFNFCHDGRSPDREFNSNDKILIHPCYWIGLNLSRNALAPEDAEQINDEYEIQVTSITPEIRVQKIGALIAEIGTIKTGKEQSHEFEDWVFRALQTIFAGHLGNLELHPNGAAVQRRDIVGTNLRKSPNWAYLQDQYQVRQVVFDAKNYAGIGRDEYRQMASYLTGVYGSAGFIVSRDEEESIKSGSELDWVREIYSTQRKLIIRFSYKFLVRMLSKLRNPEKHDIVEQGLTSVLDVYERRYLSLQSSRSQKFKK